MKIGVAVIGLLGLGLAAMLRLSHRPSVQIETIDVPQVRLAAPDAPDPADVRTEPAERPLTESERALAGTWVAEVPYAAPRRASTEGMMVELQALQTGHADPLQRCVWLELYDNLRGFQHACGVVNGEASVLQQTSAVTGRHSPLGSSLRWRFDDGQLRLAYDEDMVVQGAAGSSRFRETSLALPAEGSPPFEVTQTFPESTGAEPLTLRFEVFAGSYLDSGPPPPQ